MYFPWDIIEVSPEIEITKIYRPGIQTSSPPVSIGDTAKLEADGQGGRTDQATGEPNVGASRKLGSLWNEQVGGVTELVLLPGYSDIYSPDLTVS